MSRNEGGAITPEEEREVVAAKTFWIRSAIIILSTSKL
jgi:hypothetical protein